MPPLEKRRSRVQAGWSALACSGLALLLVAPGALAPRVASAQSRVEADKQLSEYEVKAQVLARIVKYTRWAESAFEAKDAPFVLAVHGKDPFGDALESTFKGTKVGEHRVKLVRVSDTGALGPVHLLFVAGKDERQQQKLVEQYAGKPVLLVADTLKGAELGTHVGFYLESSKLRFGINTASAKKSGLEMSSELLKLAKIVSGAPSEGALER